MQEVLSVHDKSIRHAVWVIVDLYLKTWACLGVKPGTSHTLSENHATRPTSHS